jgi:hypothetical protein
VDTYLQNIRQLVNNAYSDIRNSFISEDTSFLDIDINVSSPFIFYQISSQINNIQDLEFVVGNLLFSEDLDEICVSKIYSETVIPIYSNYNMNIGNPPTQHSSFSKISEVKNLVNLPTSTSNVYKGNGVNIGVYEAYYTNNGFINNNQSLLSNTNITYRNRQNNLSSIHATAVGAIISGSTGIAPNANIFNAEFVENSLAGFTNIAPLNWLVNNQVNVVNMSFGLDEVYGTSSERSSVSRFYDQYVYDNFITMVAASGNNGDNSIVGSPAIGNNIIAVGAINSLGTELAPYSSYSEDYNIAKPNLVAPGDVDLENNYYSFENYAPGQISGTSFAAPIVTGAIALAMQKKPLLKLYPEKIHSLITATSKMDSISPTYNSYFAGLENKVGAGLLDIKSFLDSVDNTVNFEFNSNQTDPTGTNLVLLQQFFTASTLSPRKLRVSLFWLSQIINSQRTISDYDLYIYINDIYLDSSTYSFTNIEMLDIVFNN